MALTEQQHAARAMQIGGSDAAAAVGLSRYKTPVRLWQEKLGLVQREPMQQSESAHFGYVLEDIVAQEFARRKGLKVHRVKQTRSHPRYPYMVAHFDRRVVGVRAGLECKTANWRMLKDWGEDGSENIPQEYYVQCLHYLSIARADIWYCAVLLAGSDYRIFEVQREESVIRDLIEREAYFKHCLDTRTPPELKELSDAYALYPRNTVESITATVEIAETLKSFKAGKLEMKALKARLDRAQLAIQGFMREATYLVDAAGNELADWKAQSQRQFIPLSDGIDGLVKITNMRVLRTGKS